MTKRVFYGTDKPRANGEEFGLSIDLNRHPENISATTCRLTWSVLDAKDDTLVDDPALVEQPPRDFQGNPQGCTGEAHLWVPLKPSLGKYSAVKVRVRFFAGDHEFPPATTASQLLG